MKKIFCLGLYFKIRKFIFCQSESCVLKMSSWSRVKIRGLKSSIEVQRPTVSGNLKKILYSCLCTSFLSCYCVLTEKIDENGSVVTTDHQSLLPSPSWITSCLLRRLEGVAWWIVASHCAIYMCVCVCDQHMKGSSLGTILLHNYWLGYRKYFDNMCAWSWILIYYYFCNFSHHAPFSSWSTK